MQHADDLSNIDDFIGVLTRLKNDESPLVDRQMQLLDIAAGLQDRLKLHVKMQDLTDGDGHKISAIENL